MGKPVETKRKKKGRPSLLDLQKRSIRLQKQQEQQVKKRSPKPNPSPIPNPYARFPNPAAGRRSIRRSANPEQNLSSSAEEEDDAEAADSMEEDEEDDEPKVRRKEKELKLVLHLPHVNTNSSNMTSAASELNDAVHLKQKVDAVGKSEGKNSTWKATVVPHETSNLGPTTPLPDKKLLDFILDRLQKKDTYGVFSEPVDPEELPDYHDIIKHPMDFGTVRKRISTGAYKNLEQFEGDVYLISSNAMRYNAPDTIYFRQARSIHELAKKSFENLRQESDGSERQPKIVRRGRPPGTGKNNMKPPAGRSPIERTRPEFSSEALLANSVDGNHFSGSRNDLLRKGSGMDHQGMEDVFESYNLGCERMSERNEDSSGFAWKGFSNYGKKLSVMDESRRNTYKQYQVPSSMLLDGERKVLMQVGFHVEHAYARSLARFAANLGPVGWSIAAKRIEKALSSGIKFGRGWVGEEIDAPHQSCHQPSSNPSPHPSSNQPNISVASRHDQQFEGQDELPSNSSASNIAHERFPDSNAANASMSPPPRPGMSTRPNASPGNFGLESVISRAHQWPPSSTSVGERVVEPTVTNQGIPLLSSSQGPWNVRAVDSKQPDLALQL